MTTENWQELLRSASELQQAARVVEAIAVYERLLAIKPDLPDSWYNLGFLQRHARRFEDALRSYERALQSEVTHPEEVHLNRAVIFSDWLHRPEEAEWELRAALQKNPRYVPALLNLGNLCEDRGDRSGARQAYENALSADPGNALALARLAGVSHAPQLDEDLADRLRRKMTDPRLPAEDKADLGFALAGLLDAAGLYDDAFQAGTRANEASRAASGARYDRAGVEQFVDRSIATFAAPSAGPVSGNAPVFICGMFRSGSTLIEQVVGAHSRVRTGGEFDALPVLVSNIADYPKSIFVADCAQKQKWRDEYLRQLRVKPEAAQLMTDKRPDNFLHIGLIKAIFPEAKIVHTFRNPLDNLLSLYFLHLDPSMAYALELRDAAHWYTQYRRLMTHWKAVYPDDIFDLDYDILVRQPGSAIGGVLEFLGLEWEDGVLDFHDRNSAVKTASVWQVRQPIHARSSGRWRNYEAHLSGLREALRLNQSE